MLNSDWPMLVVGLVLASCLLALAFAVLRRGQLQATAERSIAERQTMLANGTQLRAAEDAANRQAGLMREAYDARLAEMEAHLNVLYERVDAAIRATTTESEALRAQLHAALDAHDRHAEGMEERMRAMADALDRRGAGRR